MECKSFNFKFFFFQKIDKNPRFLGIDNPIFPYACIRVQIEFPDIIMAGIAGRNDFNNPVRSPCAAAVCQFVLVADYAYVRIYYGFSALLEFDCKWSWINAAFSFLQYSTMLFERTARHCLYIQN